MSIFNETPMHLQLSPNKNRPSHKDSLSLCQSLTSLIIMAKLNRLKAVLAEQDKTSKWLAEQVDKSTCTLANGATMLFNQI